MKRTSQELIQLVKELTNEVKFLKDENDALWMMLDEITESDKAAKKILDERKEKMLIELLSDIPPAGEA